MRTLFILGGGPSLREGPWRALLRGRSVLAINRAGVEWPEAEVILWTDPRVWSWYGREYLRTSAFLVEASQRSPKEVIDPRVQRYRLAASRYALTEEPGELGFGYCSGWTAIHYAVRFGSWDRIVLLGFDGGSGHWHADHPVPESSRAPDLLHRGFDELAEWVRGRGVEVWNASPGSLIRSFPTCSQEAAFRDDPGPDLRRSPPPVTEFRVPLVEPWPGEALRAAIVGAGTRCQGDGEEGVPLLSWGRRNPPRIARHSRLWAVGENGTFAHWTPGSVALTLGGVNDLRFLPPGNGKRWTPPVRSRKLPGPDAPVLVCGQMGSADPEMSMPFTWPEDVLRELRGKTSRPIWFKPHPKSRLRLPRGFDRVVQADLDRTLLAHVWATVTWTSSVATVSLAEGVPCFALGPRLWAKSLCLSDLGLIDHPPQPKPWQVEDLFYSLAWANWTREELREGWEWLWRAVK